MHPTVEILNKSFPSYWLCALLGIIACVALLLCRKKSFRSLDNVDITNSGALVCVGMIIGARVLYLVTISPILVRNIQKLIEDRSLAYEVLSNGMVFYGGLLGALLALYIYVRHYDLDSGAFFDYYAPAFPLFHAFGRVGCFMTGCCYGVECHRFGMEYHNSTIAPNDVSLFPVQLLCVALNILLFVVILNYEKRHHLQGRAMLIYLLLYAIGRFFLEFLRGDNYRGIFFGLSTSQWISVFIFIAAGRYLYVKLRKGQEG